jgi:hypothetical protein
MAMVVAVVTERCNADNVNKETKETDDEEFLETMHLNARS